jgi:hypothetical protein
MLGAVADALESVLDWSGTREIPTDWPWRAHLVHERVFTALVDRLSALPSLSGDLADSAEAAISSFLHSAPSADDEMMAVLPTMVAVLRRGNSYRRGNIYCDPTWLRGLDLSAFCLRQAAAFPALHAAGFLVDALRRPFREMSRFFFYPRRFAAQAAVIHEALAEFADDPDVAAFDEGWSNATALHVAAAANNSGGVLERIIARAKRLAKFDTDFLPSDSVGTTPLLTAVTRGCEAAARVLVVAGFNPLRCNYDELNAFRAAVDLGHVTIVEMMLDEWPMIKAHLENREPHFEPVLVVAIRLEHLGILRLLLAAGADPFATEWAESRRALVGTPRGTTQRLANLTDDPAIIAAVAAACQRDAQTWPTRGPIVRADEQDRLDASGRQN